LKAFLQNLSKCANGILDYCGDKFKKGLFQGEQLQKPGRDSCKLKRDLIECFLKA